LAAPRVFIVPLFMSEGYFSERLIPRALGMPPVGKEELGRVQRQDHQTIFYCKPVGTHERITAVVLARATEVTRRFPSRPPCALAETTLFVAGHGTRREPNSRRAVERQVQIIRTFGQCADVQGVFLEEDPRIDACWQLATTRTIVVVPFFISDGLHVQEDIPVLLGETREDVQRRLTNGQPAWPNPTEREGKLLWLSRSVGTHPDVAAIIMERVAEAAAVELQ
jgi:sirohydrochlorin cobaltochelatase